MPRIAAFFASIALMAASIGLNIVRYPVVWDMVGASPALSPTVQPLQTLAAAQPKPAPQVATAAKTSESKGPARAESPAKPPKAAGGAGRADNDAQPQSADQGGKPREVGGAATDVKPGSVNATPVSLDPQRPPAEKAAQNGNQSGNPNGKGKNRGGKSGPSKPATQKSPETTPSPEPVSGAAGGETKMASAAGKALVPVVYPGVQEPATVAADLPAGIRRLPPIDQITPPPPGHLSPYAPGQPVPLYPRTGI